MLIGVLGYKGFIGAEIYTVLSKYCTVVGIGRDNYQEWKGGCFDVLVNAMENSLKYLSNRDPGMGFQVSKDN